MARRLCRPAALAARPFPALCVSTALGAALAACGGGGGGGDAARRPGIVATVLSFPPGSVPPGDQLALVEVVDADTGAPIPGATVTLNGVALPYVPASQEYEGAIDVAPGASVDLRVTVGGHGYSISAQQLAAPPAIDDPPAGASWPSGCDGTVAWSGGASAQADEAFLLALDPVDPNAQPALQLRGLAASGGSVTVGANTFHPGDLLLVSGLLRTVSIPEAAVGSTLVLAVASAQPLHVANATYRELVLGPVNRGLSPGEVVSYAATAPSCVPGGFEQDLTQAATWSTSAPEVASVDGAGLVTGGAQGIATLSASVDGIGGSTLVGVRSFTLRATPPGTDYLAAVALTGTGLVAAGSSGVILTSPDGVDWTPRSSGTAASITGVAASPSRIVAVEFGSSAMVTSTDGVAWAPGGAGTLDSMWSVAWTGAGFVAVGVSGAIVTSTDGVTWTPRDVPLPSVLLRAVLWTGTEFIAVGDGVPVTSPDGITWTAQPGPSGMLGVAAGGGELMAVGDLGHVATSTDGRTWITWTLDPGFRLGGVAWTGSRFVVVGAYGRIYTSP